MKPAKPTDWKTEPLPAKRTTIRLERSFSPQEMERIRPGLVPEQMEDKWFIYWHRNTLYFHRSWTGFCIYAVRFTYTGEDYRIVEAEVNRDPEQYKETSDERDGQIISYLIDMLLIRQYADFPSDEVSTEKRALMNWSLIGRAMFDQHPDEE